MEKKIQSFIYIDNEGIEFLVDFIVTAKQWDSDENDPGAPAEIEVVRIESRGIVYAGKETLAEFSELLGRIESAIQQGIAEGQFEG